ncbi:MAG: IclR family transcriptional regulator [Chloroflexota bacterium]
MAIDGRDIGQRAARSLTVEKALNLLDVVVGLGEPASVVTLSRTAGLDKTTAHRLVTSLARFGLLRFDPLARTYSLGLRLVELGNEAIAQLSLPREARPYMERLGLESGEAVHLGVYDEGQVVYVDQVPSSQPVVVRARVGGRAPLHCTAMGKVLLAFGPPDWVDELADQDSLPALTPNSITSADDLREHLARVRRLGYAVDEEENRIGVRCVSAPILDRASRALAAVSITGPTPRLSRERLLELVRPLKEATIGLSMALGYAGSPELETRVASR